MTKQETLAASVDYKASQQFAVWSLFAMAVCLVLADPASAFNTTGISQVLCNAAYLVVFDIGRGLASLAIIAVGIAAMLGKASWGQAISLGVGIGVVFGSLTIATTLTTGLDSFIGFTIPAIPCTIL